eukprot:TRINITY_DN9397_c0_g2_i1.p1 TRINITY_DN9397_c0_g2~~TRINITY_DN9397_c0_g2_i1.p1  ORF type:complete len:229 (-),score=69.15 TRINITY_DN9397_c0_g2_i1:57-707(-)
MRTPKGKQRGGGGAMRTGKTEVNKLRKKAMKNKMMKKTMLTLAGDDTKDEIRDLMNDSGNLSSISIIGRSPAAASSRQTTSKAAKTKSPGRKKVAKSESSLSLKSLSAQLTRRSSRRKLKEEPSPAKEDKMEVMEVNGDEALAKQGDTIKVVKIQNGDHEQNGHTEEAGVSRLQGVKNMLSSAVWGVPYAKVVEDGDGEANMSQVSNSAESRCVIS